MTDDTTGDRPPAIEELDNLHVGPPPVRAVIDAGHAAKRRRRTIFASVAAVAVLATGVSVAATAGTDKDSNRSVDTADAMTTSDAQPFPDPPSGERWVGMNGVVVAVPVDWPVTDSPCGSRAAAEVVNGSGAAAVDCIEPGGGDARVTFAPLDSGPEPSTERSCLQMAPPTCSGAVRFSDQNLGIQVQIQADDAAAQVERILDSAMVMPDGWTTVPFAWGLTVEQRVEALESAGFEVDGLGGRTGQAEVRTTPEIGSPVREGSTITLAYVGTSNPSDAPQELAVTVNRYSPYALNIETRPGTARWEPRSRTITYIPRFGYSGSCPPSGTVEQDGGTLTLVLSAITDRVCTADDPGMVATISGLAEAPAELTVIENGETRTVTVTDAEPDGVETSGDPAVWSVAPGERPTPTSTSFTAAVSRLGCNSGVTGDVLEPRVDYNPSQIIVTFEVAADRDGGLCPSNKPVDVQVDLSEPIGDRDLIDGQCRPGAAAETTSFCSGSKGVR